MNKIVFLDKDGTLVVDEPYNVDPEKIIFYPDVVHALRRLQDAGFRLVVVSNQSGVAMGYFKEEALGVVEKTIVSFLRDNQIALDGFYYCPHHPEGLVPYYREVCECRKPAPGMLVRAARELEADLSSSWMIGDILHDVEAGNQAGCRTILIDNGNETEWEISPLRVPYKMASSLAQAASIIIKSEKKRGIPYGKIPGKDRKPV